MGELGCGVWVRVGFGEADTGRVGALSRYSTTVNLNFLWFGDISHEFSFVFR